MSLTENESNKLVKYILACYGSCYLGGEWYFFVGGKNKNYEDNSDKDSQYLNKKKRIKSIRRKKGYKKNQMK